jgi:hypothetical protein
MVVLITLNNLVEEVVTSVNQEQEAGVFVETKNLPAGRQGWC